MDINALKQLPPSMRPSKDDQIIYMGLSEAIFGPVKIDQEHQDIAKSPLRTYLLLDAAADRDIYLSMNGYANEAKCLFDGQVADDLERVGPWLVEIERDDSVWTWFVQNGYGKNWGIIIHSRLELRRLKTQLKKFLKIEDEDGKEYFFKFFRPQNFNAYYPEFTAEQRQSFSRGIETIFAETHGVPELLQPHQSDPEGLHLTQQILITEAGQKAVQEFENEIDDAFWTSATQTESNDAS